MVKTEMIRKIKVRAAKHWTKIEGQS